MKHSTMRKQILLFISAAFIATSSLAQTNGTLKFNNAPFTNGNEAGKTSFKSNEFIYARAELGMAVKDYFKITRPDDVSEKHFLVYTASMAYTNVNRKNQTADFTPGYYLFISPEDFNKTHLDFDIIPNPAIASSVFCIVSNFQGALFTNPVYYTNFHTEVKNNTNINFRIVLVGGVKSTNEANSNKQLPKVAGEFNLAFSEADGSTLKQNEELSTAKVKKDGFSLTALPAIFSKPFKSADSKLQAAKLAAILKRDYPDRKVLKMVLDNDGGASWLIAKNDFGIPRYRYYNGVLHIAYKEDGECKVGTVELIETYLGGGKYGQLMADYSSEYDRKINCALIK